MTKRDWMRRYMWKGCLLLGGADTFSVGLLEDDSAEASLFVGRDKDESPFMAFH